MRCVHTSAGNRWRSGLRRPDGSLPERARSLETEREFWRRRVQAGLPPPDDYAVPVLAALLELAEAAGVSSVLEIGPGWGNYTLPLCRRFDRVACVDLSPDNLRWLSRAAEAEGLRLETVCAPWETAEASPCDLVFGYNCLYRLTEPELFLRKMNASAARLCVIGMNRPPELPWLPALEAAGLKVHYTRQGCEDLAGVLEELGIRARLVDIPNVRDYRYPDRQSLLRRAEQFLAAPCPEDMLWELLAPFHHREAGSWVCRYPFRSQLLVWEPVQT